MITQVIQDRWGQVSSRRVAGFVGLTFLCGCGVAAFLGHPVPDHLVDVFAMFTGGCFSLATADHFAPDHEATNA